MDKFAGFWLWFRRAWPPVIILVILISSIGLLVVLRSDPAFNSISALLGVFIGGMTTALVQVALQTREQVTRRDEAEYKRLNELWDGRVAIITKMLEDIALYVLDNLGDTLKFAREHERFPNIVDKAAYLNKFEKRMESTSRVSDIRGRAIILTFASPELNSQLDNFDAAWLDAFKSVGATASAADILAILESTEKKLYAAMAAIYLELDRLRSDSVLRR